MNKCLRNARPVVAWLMTLFVSACGGGGDSGGGPEPVYAVGGTVSGLSGGGLVLRNNGGDDLAVGANGPFTFTTPLRAGSMYAVTVGHQPTDSTLNCLVMNGGGSGVVAAANLTAVTVKCAEIGRFNYVANAGSSSVAGFTVNAANGALQPISDSPFAVSGGASALAVDPLRKFVFVGTGEVTAFMIDTASGKLVTFVGSQQQISSVAIDGAGMLTTLSAVPAPCFYRNSDVFTRTVYAGLAVDPFGRFVYATCPTGIWVYAIDPANGTLALDPGSPYIPGTLSPASIAVTN